MARLQLGLIGAGGVVQMNHLPALEKVPQIKVAAIADNRPGRAEEVARKRGIARHFEDYRALLAAPGVDAVLVALPNALHAEASIAALEADKHVLCEKPLARTPGEARDIVAAAREAGRVLAVGCHHRFHPHVTALKRAIEAGDLGEIYLARAWFLRARGSPALGSWFTNKQLSGGGPLIDLGVHMLDLSWWLAGRPQPVSVAGVAFHKLLEGMRATGSTIEGYGDGDPDGVVDVEDLGLGLVRCEEGRALRIEASWAHNGPSGRGVMLYGTKGGAELEIGAENRVTLWRAEGAEMVSSPLDFPEGPPAPVNLLKAFAARCAGGETPVATGEDGVTVLSVLDALYRSAAAGFEVKVG